MSSVQDVRPGLLFKPSIKRQFEVEQKQKKVNENQRKVNKPANVLEAERREEGLKEAITADNKGFAMLRKMGFDPTKGGLGKSGEGRTEPVPVEIKVDRGGLGREAALKEISRRKLAILAKKISSGLTPDSINEFRARMRNQTTEKQTAGDLRKSQRICQVLDEEKGINEPDEIWFWPEKIATKEDEEDEEETVEAKKQKLETEEKDEEECKDECFEPSEKLEILTSYLRLSHNYCIFCGIKFENEEDMDNSCPGSSREDH